MKKRRSDSDSPSSKTPKNTFLAKNKIKKILEKKVGSKVNYYQNLYSQIFLLNHYIFFGHFSIISKTHTTEQIRDA
jgi:hypothetical protein